MTDSDGEAVRFQFYENGESMAFLNLTPAETKTVYVQAVDSDGKPAPLRGMPAYTILPDGIATITPSADGFSLQVVGVTEGTATVTAKGVSMSGKTFASSFDTQVMVAAPEAIAFLFSETAPAR